MALLNVILNYNCFKYYGKCFKPIKGIAMGLPISGIVAELYLQYFEELSIGHWLESGEILYYRRFVDYFLIIFDQNKTNEPGISFRMNTTDKHLVSYLNFPLKIK